MRNALSAVSFSCPVFPVLDFVQALPHHGMQACVGAACFDFNMMPAHQAGVVGADD